MIVLSILTTTESDWATTSAVHRALTTEELQRSIFVSLLLGQFAWSPWSNAKRDLLSVALTCQAFTEVALDILYNDVSLHDLLQIWRARGILRRVQTPSASLEMVRAKYRIPKPLSNRFSPTCRLTRFGVGFQTPLNISVWRTTLTEYEDCPFIVKSTGDPMATGPTSSLPSSA